MDAENDGTSGGTMYVDIPFTTKVNKIPPQDGTVERLVPHLAGLLYPVDTLQEPPNPILLTRVCETRRLFHKHCLIRGKNAMEEGHFDVELTEVPVQ